MSARVSMLSRLFLISSFVLSASIVPSAPAQSGAWPTHSHDDQHTGLSSVASQPLNAIHWTTRVDLVPPPAGEILIHYGSPLVTARNTVIVPVKTHSVSQAQDRFQVQARNGATGALLYIQGTQYYTPYPGLFQFTPPMGPTLHGNKLYVPDIAGSVLVREDPDSPTGKVTRLFFYGAKNYARDATAYEQNVQIDTPLTTDAAGNLYFGFIVTGATPLNLGSGLARIAPDGTATWISAQAATGFDTMDIVAFNAAPALSRDGKLLYVVFGSSLYFDGYLAALDSRTLRLVSEQPLIDPAAGQEAIVFPSSSATPTVGPDGDVYYGVLEYSIPTHNDRGWLLHFNRDLTEVKVPGSFGWDDTASIVPASMVPSYTGASKYLLMTKYNNYAYSGTGDGENKIAILDPHATEDDPVLPSTKVMNEVLTIVGPTPNPTNWGVYEWCINTAAVDPFTKSVLVNSEDGNLYRWDLTTDTLTQKVRLSQGIGEAYTPTVIGQDGTVYAINDAILDAVGK